jgi:hypothetical protein
MNRRAARRALPTLLLALALVAPIGATAEPLRNPAEDPDPVTLVRLAIPGRDVLDIVAANFDLAGNFARVPDGVQVDAVVTEEEALLLDALGVRILAPDDAWSWADVDPTADAVEGSLVAFADDGTAAAGDTVFVGRVDYFTTREQGFISVEAKTTDGATSSVQLRLSYDDGPGTPIDSNGPNTMSRFVDSGVYMFHRLLIPVDARPEQVQVASTNGGVGTGFASDWLYDVEPLTSGRDYEYDFVDHYMNPTELYDKIDSLAAEFPDLAEIQVLPNASNGYRRKAQALFGSSNANRVVVTSKAWGHEGGNDITVQFVNPGAPSQPLTVEASGNGIVVSLATNDSGSPASTAAQVVAAIDAGAAALVDAHTYRGNSGTGTVAAAGPVALTDFLSAPDSISRDPWAIRALRIGKHRDGSKTGVLIIAQDHAREWVTPLVAVETAERLLRNYASDPESRKIINNTEIWIVPSNNPDGSHYSMFDRALQRRNMTNHCEDNNSDPGRRTSWGVDLNRNYSVGSGFDGYSGASTSCISDTYQGPAEISEPESKNIVWLAENHRNLKFFMTIHSNGGQLFWQPGAYIAQGRITTPRPEMKDEAYYWQMAERILSHVKAYQDTVVRPDNVGGSSDVLYSSAGNVREELYFNYGVYAMGWEIGGSTWNPTTRTWQSGSFQPAWERAHGEAMEYSNGVMEMFRIAADYGKDFSWATSRLVKGAPIEAGVPVTFETDEPSTVYYTTDGSRPTFGSSRYNVRAFREGGETLVVTETTTFHWFSVDSAGNIEQNYDPTGNASNYRKQTVKVD